MTVSLVNLTFKLADLIGTTFEARRTLVEIRTNLDGGAILDADGNEIYLGNAKATVADDGTGSFVGLVATNSATNPTAFQYRVTVRYQPRLPQQQTSAWKTWDSGWFSLTATADLADVVAAQYVPPTYVNSITQQLDAKVTEAAGYAQQAHDISKISTSDGVVAALVNDSASTTSAALKTSYASAVAGPLATAGNLPRRMIPSPVLGVGRYIGLFDSATSATGAGYAVGDIVQINGGPGLAIVPAQIRVTSVDGVPGSNAITGTVVHRPGIYTNSGAAVVINGLTSTTITGTGTGAEFNTDWRLSAISGITDPALIDPTDARIRHTGRVSTNIGGSGYYGDDLGTAWRMSYEWATDDPTPEIRLIGIESNVQLFVDGAQVSATDITTDNSGQPYLLVLKFPTKTMRNFRLVGVNQGFGGVRIASTSTFSAPTVTRPLAVAFGDSYSVGNGAENSTSQALQVACDMLGLDLIVRGQGGTGWNSTGADLPVTRVTDGLNMDRVPDFIFWDLGYNDQGTDMGTLTANLNAAVDKAQTLAPSAVQIAFGPATPLGSTPALTAVKNAVRDAMVAQGVAFVDVEGWVTAKNAALYTGSDGTHPTPLGHKFIGAHKALAVQSIVNG